MTPLSPSLRRNATELLVDAFEDDPLFNFLTPDPATRDAFLAAVMGTNLALAEPRGANHAIVDPSLRGICIWFRPGDHPIPIGEQLRARGRAIAGALARRELRPRVIARAWRLGDLMDEALPEPPYFYLQVLAVAPALHGRGLGSSMLRACCAEADAAGLPAYLETSKEMNARLYRRFGFETTRTTIFESGPPAWTMRRDPRPLS